MNDVRSPVGRGEWTLRPSRGHATRGPGRNPDVRVPRGRDQWTLRPSRSHGIRGTRRNQPLFANGSGLSDSSHIYRGIRWERLLPNFGSEARDVRRRSTREAQLSARGTRLDRASSCEAGYEELVNYSDKKLGVNPIEPSRGPRPSARHNSSSGRLYSRHCLQPGRRSAETY